LKKPFEVLAEGLFCEKSRGDRIPLELFLDGIQGWEAGLRQRMLKTTYFAGLVFLISR
jgi:hypothetical protein